MHDLIIVGAGTAGCVLAGQLSESGKLRILLIEAGGKPSSPFVRMPAGFARLFQTKVDWNFKSEPQMSAGGRKVYIPRGKMLGGCSNLNAQVHQWCHPVDFAGWEEAGAEGWGWDAVEPILRKQENHLADSGDVRGHDGPMFVSPNRNTHPLSERFVQAARSAGLGTGESYNGVDYEGAWLCELAHRDGKRFSAYNAYLEPALRRENLEVLADALVTSILFEEGQAVGVAIRRGNHETTHRARGVVLAAGAFGTPQILMLSGVGPASHLRELGIPIVRDVPEIGRNLQDHPLAPVLFRTRTNDSFKKAQSPLALLRYVLFKRGPLASNAVEAIAFTRIIATSAPDLELVFVPFEWREEGLAPPSVHAFGIAAAVVGPRSRGSMRLRSASPEQAPIIDLGLLNDPDGIDASVLVAGARLARKIASLPPLSDENAGELVPGAELQTDEELRTGLCQQLQTVYHPTSTCRMGSDEGAVVTPKLEARGIGGLWIADASVMPSVPRGHPNAVVAMIANRAAPWIEQSLVGSKIS